MILVKKLKFIHRLCLSKIDREKVFADVLDKRAAFKDFKNNCLSKTQNKNFSKGLVHGLGQKFHIFLTFLFMPNTARKTIC